jgi:hypothetical protein
VAADFVLWNHLTRSYIPETGFFTSRLCFMPFEGSTRSVNYAIADVYEDALIKRNFETRMVESWQLDIDRYHELSCSICTISLQRRSSTE